MRFWWLIPIILVVVALATAVGWWQARRAGMRSGKKGWVANTGYLRALPKYQALVRRTRSSLAMAVVCFLIAVIATSVSAGAPVDRYVKHDKSASRDIVLCLDASGSMLRYDSKIGDSFREIISHFDGERISLQLWDVYLMTMFRLALPHHRLLHLQSRVFIYRQSAQHQCRYCRAARLPQHQCGSGINVHKHLLHRRLIRLVSIDNLTNVLHNNADAPGQLVARDGFDAAGCHVALALTQHINHTKSRYPAA